LTETGWKVDPIPGSMADAYVYTGAKRGGDTQVYVHGQSMAPRITGGPDDGDIFWVCLARVLRSDGQGSEVQRDGGKAPAP
jgi:phage repressor protein C with HTH and peptisase S24 domain